MAETGSRCWGSGQQDANEVLRMLGAATRPCRANARLRGYFLRKEVYHMEIIVHQAILHVLDTTLDAPVLSGSCMEMTAEKTAYLQ